MLNNLEIVQEANIGMEDIDDMCCLSNGTTVVYVLYPFRVAKLKLKPGQPNYLVSVYRADDMSQVHGSKPFGSWIEAFDYAADMLAP